MLNLIPLLVVLLLLILLAWPTAKAAQLVGAVQTSLPMAIAAIIGGTLLTIVITVPLGFAVALATKAPPPGAMLLLIGVLASAFAYAKILETSFLGGVAIYAIQTACWLALSGLAYLGMTNVAPELATAEGISDVRTIRLRAAADEVCNCGTDQDCLSRNYRVLRKIAGDYESALLLPAEKTKVEEYSRRAKLCVMQPSAPGAEDPQAAAPAAAPSS